MQRDNGRYRSRAAVLATMASLLASSHVQAYLDPGTGSMLLQVILGGFAAAGVALKLYWHRIKAVLGFGKADSEDVPRGPGDGEG